MGAIDWESLISMETSQQNASSHSLKSSSFTGVRQTNGRTEVGRMKFSFVFVFFVCTVFRIENEEEKNVNKHITYGFRWNRKETLRGWSSWVELWGRWPSFVKECSCHRCPSCRLEPRGSKRFSRSWCIRRPFHGRRSRRSHRYRTIQQSWVL